MALVLSIYFLINEFLTFKILYRKVSKHLRSISFFATSKFPLGLTYGKMRYLQDLVAAKGRVS